MKSAFDYESKIFGLGEIKTKPWFIPALKIQYSLDSIKEIKGKVLEVGCGGGAMAKSIAKYRKDLKVYGVDFSKGAIKIAKRRPSGVDFKFGDVYKLPYKNTSFDAIVCFDVFEHLDYLEKAFAEVRRVTKKGGIVHIAIPFEGDKWNLEGWLTRLGWTAKEIYCGHVSNFKVGDLEKIAEKNGFKLIKRQYSNHFLYQIVDALYFTYIFIRGKNIPLQVEGIIDKNKNNVGGKILNWLKLAFSTITYYESILLAPLPALTGHLTFRKK